MGKETGRGFGRDYPPVVSLYEDNSPEVVMVGRLAGEAKTNSDPLTVGWSALMEMVAPEQPHIYELTRPIIDFMAGKDPDLSMYQSTVAHIAFQGVAPDLCPGLRQVLPQVRLPQPDGSKAEAMIKAVLSSRDIDLATNLDLKGLLLSLDANMIRFFPRTYVSRMPGFYLGGKRPHVSWRILKDLELSEELRSLHKISEEETLVPLISLDAGTYDSGVKYLHIGIEALSLDNSQRQPLNQKPKTLPLFQLQVISKESVKRTKAEIEGMGQMNPYRVLSWDVVVAELGEEPFMVWEPVRSSPWNQIKRWSDDRSFISLSGVWWPRTIDLGVRSPGLLRKLVGSDKMIIDSDYPENVLLRSVGNEQAFRASLARNPGTPHVVSVPLGIENEHWFKLSEENKKILGSPVELVGLERLNPVEQAFVLSRLLFKVTEAEWMLSLSEEGKERLLNAEEKYVVAGVREADVVRIHKVVGDLTQKENSSRSSLEHAVAADTTDKSQAFTKNILVAMGVNPIRAWRYLSELELTKLMPALSHLSRRECQDIWWKEVRFSDEASAKLIDPWLHDQQKWFFNGENASEIAYDSVMAELTYKGKLLSEDAIRHFEFGWTRMARILRQHVSTELAQIENDIEFLLEVFSL